MNNKNFFKNLTISRLSSNDINNEIMISKSFIDLLEIEEIIRTNKLPNFPKLFDNKDVKEIVNTSKVLAKFIIFHQRYEFNHYDIDFLLESYPIETIKMYILELYENEFENDLTELIKGLREILIFYQRIETTNKKLTRQLKQCVIEVCYCIHTIKHFFDDPDINYLNEREISIQEFYHNFQLLMSKTYWRVQYINLSSKKITNVSDHLQISKTKREQNFILWTTLGAIIAFFVKEILFNILHFLHVPFF